MDQTNAQTTDATSVAEPTPAAVLTPDHQHHDNTTTTKATVTKTPRQSSNREPNTGSAPVSQTSQQARDRSFNEKRPERQSENRGLQKSGANGKKSKLEGSFTSRKCDTILTPDDYEGGASQPLLASSKRPVQHSGCCGPNLLVYCSHFLSAWGDRMWSFAVGLFLVIINPDSLQLTAVYGLTMGGSVLLLGPVVGDWVDTTPRLKAARLSLVLQNVMVVLCSALIYAFIVYRSDLLEFGSWTEDLTFALIIIFASVANLLTLANTISVEKDWIVEICGQEADKLASMTSTMRAIDLTTQILAPIATGQIMTYAGNENGCIFITAWNLASVVVEYFLIWKVYNNVPALRKMKDTPTNKGTNNGSNECRIFSSLTIIVRGWKTYASYPVMLSGLALSLLFMTVLGFGNDTVGYAKIQGLSESVIGIMMGGGGAVGIFGALAYPYLRRCMGLPRTGLFSLTLLVSCLSACVVSVWLPGSPFDMFGNTPTSGLDPNCTSIVNMSLVVTPSVNDSSHLDTVIAAQDIYPCEQPENSQLSVIVLMAGIISARAGLWITDLSITQMFMETVAERERGVVNGVQGSMNKLLDMVKSALVVGLPLAPQFGLLVLLSFGSIFCGWLVYVVFYWRLPKKMFAEGSCCGGGGGRGYQKI